MKEKLYKALVELYDDYKGLAGNRKLEAFAGAKALVVIKEYEEHKWKKWSGGECPVPQNTRVKVKLRNGTVVTNVAMNLRWDYNYFDDDIVKYKIVKNK